MTPDVPGTAAGWRIEPASPAHVPYLPAIEERAGALFDLVEDTRGLPAYLTPLEEFSEGQARGLLWVALLGEQPVAFALAERWPASLHLEELDVLPECGRRGIGTALVAVVCARARAEGLPVTLTTFGRVPWNRPFYERLGFRVLDEAALSPELRARAAEEARAGLPRG